MDKAEIHELESAIDAVVVYTDRARVTRKGAIQLTAGEHALELRNLPMRLIPESVRVTGRGEGIRISGIDTAVDQVIEAPEENLAALGRELESLQKQDAEIRDRLAGAAARSDLMLRLGQYGAADLSKGLAYGRATLETIQSLATYLDHEQDGLLARKRSLEQERIELSKKIEAAKARMASVRQPQPRERRKIQVSLEAAAETEFTFELSYLIAGASWSPQYDMRLRGETLEVSYLASVTQNTGEDWPSTALALSTARPAVAQSIPELQPWYLDVFAVPSPPRMAAQPAPATVQPGAFTQMFQATPAAAPAPPPPPATFRTATVEAAGPAMTYRVSKPVAIPSDGSPHRTLIGGFDLRARLDYVTAPRIAQEVYLRATVANSSNLVLLPGQANVFHDDEFTGTTRLDNIAPGEEFELQLGVDDRIKIERELSGRGVAKTFIGNNRRLTYAWRTRIESLLDGPARITVMDQLPHSRREEIKVRLAEVSPKPSKQTELGIIEWELTLAPRQKAEIALAFTVEHPRDMQVAGLRD